MPSYGHTKIKKYGIRRVVGWLRCDVLTRRLAVMLAFVCCKAVNANKIMEHVVKGQSCSE